MLLRFQWQIESCSLLLVLGPGLVSTSPHNIIKSLARLEHMHTNVMDNRKNKAQNLAFVFKTLPLDTIKATIKIQNRSGGDESRSARLVEHFELEKTPCLKFLKVLRLLKIPTVTLN